MTKTDWWLEDIETVCRSLHSDVQNGLSLREVQKRQMNGKNVLETDSKNSAIRIFFLQLTDTMMLILIAAALLSLLIGKLSDALTICSIVLLNTILGFVQEFQTEKSLAAMQKLTAPEAVVWREGKQQTISAEDLVVGDKILLESGNQVPADVRMMECQGLLVDESALTGESAGVEKISGRLQEADVPLAFRQNMAYMGTLITQGRGWGIVVAIGMDTEIGQIAQLIHQNPVEPTPLQQRLAQLGRILIVLCLSVCILVAVLGVFRGEALFTMLMTGISLAVAAIPEGLPAVVTVGLALGVRRMAGKKALIRKLPAVETLGCTTIICSDKTGTLTQNQMTVCCIGAGGEEFSVTGNGYALQGEILQQQQKILLKKHPALLWLLKIALLCNHAEIRQERRHPVVKGDATEVALLVLAKKSGIETTMKQVGEYPFDSVRKCMSVVVSESGQDYLLVKGALERILPLCSSYQGAEGRLHPWNQKMQEQLEGQQQQWGQQGLRVLGFAWRKLEKREKTALPTSAADIERNLVFCGLCGMMDPPRAESAQAVADCLQAGILPVMITGDHPTTAGAIACQLGIIEAGGQVITGNQLQKMDDEELYQATIKNRVFARVEPQHKQRIVRVLQKNRHVVAMTGDGINDAPALKAADIGVAMGKGGTQVAREAADMVLMDDNFHTIIEAVRVGRGIYENICRFIRYLLGSNIGEVLLMLLASLCGMPLPVLPIQILWVNLITDGLPALALGLEMPSAQGMNQPPRARDESIFAQGLGKKIFLRGVEIAGVSVLFFIVGVVISRSGGSHDLTLARTMSFTALVFSQLFYVFSCRSEAACLFSAAFFQNRLLLFAVLFSLITQVAVVEIPWFQSIFHTVSLSGGQWLAIVFMTGLEFFKANVAGLFQKICFSFRRA